MKDREIEAFVERVMTATETVPSPAPARAFGRALRAGAWRDAVAIISVAWHLGTVRAWSVAPRVRARSLALVLGVASVLATGSIVAAAAVRVAVPDEHRLPPASTPETQASSAPIVDGPGMDDSGRDAIQLQSPRPVRPGAAGTEPAVGPSDAAGRGNRHPADGAAGTARPRNDANDDDATDPQASGGDDRGGATESQGSDVGDGGGD
jgi:hypothetical protein